MYFVPRCQLFQLIFFKVVSWYSHLSANLSFFSQYVSFSLHSLFSSYLLPPMLIVFTFHEKPSVFLSTHSQFLSHFLSCLNVTFLFSSLLDHVFDTHNSFSRQNCCSILPSNFLWLTPFTMSPSKPICMPTHVSIEVTQGHNYIICTMHIPLTFQLIMKNYFSSKLH